MMSKMKAVLQPPLKFPQEFGNFALCGTLAVTMILFPITAQADRIVQLSPLVPNNGAATTTTSSSSSSNIYADPYSTDYNSASPYSSSGSASSYGSNGSTSSADAYGNERIELRARVTTIPKGTVMLVKLDQPVSSFSSHIGDSVSGTLETDIFSQDSVVIPAGSEVVGQVTNVNPSGRLGKHGEIEIQFNAVRTVDNKMVPLEATLVTKDNTGVLKGNSYGKDVLTGVGYAAGGTGVGALLGTATGGLLGATAAGAVFGTAVGGIAGITYALTRTGKDVVLPRGARLSIMTDSDIKVN